MSWTYKVCKTVELLAEQTRALAPASDFAVEKVEHETSERECECRVQLGLVLGDEEAGGGEYGERATESIHDSDKVGESEISTLAEMLAPVLGNEAEGDLDMRGLTEQGRSVRRCHCISRGPWPSFAPR